MDKEILYKGMWIESTQINEERWSQGQLMICVLPEKNKYYNVNGEKTHGFIRFAVD